MLGVAKSRSQFLKSLHLFYILMLNLCKACIMVEDYGRALEALSLCKKIVLKECDECQEIAIGEELRTRIFRDYEEYSRFCKFKVLEMREFERVLLLVAHENFPNLDSELTQLKMSDNNWGMVPDSFTNVGNLLKKLQDDLESRFRSSTSIRSSVFQPFSAIGNAIKLIGGSADLSQHLVLKNNDTRDFIKSKMKEGIVKNSALLKWANTSQEKHLGPGIGAKSAKGLTSRSTDRASATASTSRLPSAILNSSKHMLIHSGKPSLGFE